MLTLQTRNRAAFPSCISDARIRVYLSSINQARGTRKYSAPRNAVHRTRRNKKSGGRESKVVLRSSVAMLAMFVPFFGGLGNKRSLSGSVGDFIFLLGGWERSFVVVRVGEFSGRCK